MEPNAAVLLLLPPLPLNPLPDTEPSYSSSRRMTSEYRHSRRRRERNLTRHCLAGGHGHKGQSSVHSSITIDGQLNHSLSSSSIQRNEHIITITITMIMVESHPYRLSFPFTTHLSSRCFPADSCKSFWIRRYVFNCSWPNGSLTSEDRHRSINRDKPSCCPPLFS